MGKRITEVRKLRIAVVLAGVILAPAAKAGSVLELFTSHGCYSCPPAEALFNELKQQDDSLIALEYHVDYWNSLVYGSAGSWTDPFSKAEYSQRQRNYSHRDLKGREGVYTPQAIVNGAYAAVGSNRRQVTSAVAQQLDDGITVDVGSSDNQYVIRVNNVNDDASASEANVWVVRYIKSITTEITSGENKGKILENHNVVTSVEKLGSVPRTDSAEFTASASSDPNIGCAVLIQDDFQSPILAASKCPS